MNYDSTGLRRIRKGQAVTMEGKTGEVVKLCRGSALVVWGDRATPSPEWCKDLTVVKEVARQTAQLVLF